MEHDFKIGFDLILRKTIIDIQHYFHYYNLLKNLR
jgi:hypothetical protein